MRSKWQLMGSKLQLTDLPQVTYDSLCGPSKAPKRKPPTAVFGPSPAKRQLLGGQTPLTLIYQCLARQQVGYHKTACEVLATTYAVTHSSPIRTSNRRNSSRYCSRPS